MERLTEWFDDGILKGVLVKEEYGAQSIKTIFEENDVGYRGMCTLKAYEDTDLTTEQIRELKERDTAKSAVITGYNRAIGCKVGECPKCGAMTRDYLKFCSECGQRIKWEE